MTKKERQEKQVLLEALFEKTYGGVKAKLGDDINEEQYHAYLSRQYSKRLHGLRSVDFCAEDEKEKWQYYMSKNDLMLSILKRDKELERLELLAENALDDAISKSEYRQFLSMEEYESRLKELNECMFNIKPHNLMLAKKTLLCGILDLNYACGKTYFDSLWLEEITNRSVQKKKKNISFNKIIFLEP